MKIAELRNILKPNKQSESLGLVFRVCQPFSGPPDYIYTGNCSEGEIPIGQMPQVRQFSSSSPTKSHKEPKLNRIRSGPSNAHLLQKWELGRVRKGRQIPLGRRLQRHLGCDYVDRGLAWDISRPPGPLRVLLREEQAPIRRVPPVQTVPILVAIAVGIDAHPVHLHGGHSVALGDKSLPGQGKDILRVLHLPAILIPGETVRCSENVTRILYICGGFHGIGGGKSGKNQLSDGHSMETCQWRSKPNTAAVEMHLLVVIL